MLSAQPTLKTHSLQQIGNEFIRRDDKNSGELDILPKAPTQISQKTLGLKRSGVHFSIVSKNG